MFAEHAHYLNKSAHIIVLCSVTKLDGDVIALTAVAVYNFSRFLEFSVFTCVVENQFSVGTCYYNCRSDDCIKFVFN
jgi:hypothetical protein